MKGLILLVVALALSLWVGGASAEELEGTVQSVNEKEGMIVLEDGTEFSVGEDFSWEGIEPGNEVLVTFEEEEDGKKVITDYDLVE